MTLPQILAAAAMAVVLASHAQTTPGSEPTPSTGSTTTVNEPLSDGEVRKIDLDQGKITLRHGPLQNLDMPAMTMVFKTADAKLLLGINEGDKVKFTAEKLNGAFTITAIRVAR
ncbi:copper-binding protein [Variovorax sp. HJSM1_2]|uniref:copper-binding protein n=1 Tax=Variovorax sp. HJSM1_2 TaxID=3366263 RepID=UPI003BEBC076